VSRAMFPTDGKVISVDNEVEHAVLTPLGRRYIARGLNPPTYGPRAPRPQKVDPYAGFTRDGLQPFPQLSAVRDPATYSIVGIHLPVRL
jgi:hypothetical protein